MSLTINSFFTSGGTPTTGLSPTIRIWEITGGLYNLVIGAPAGSSLAVDGVMTEVTDVPNTPDGFYSFDFTTALGFNPAAEYLIRTNGGVILPITERFQTISFTPDSLDEPQITHNIVGSVGANISGLVLDVADIELMVELLLKYDTNRTKIDTVNKKLLIFDDDCLTILRSFDLLDSSGNPSVTEVCERLPKVATDGLPVCP